MEPKKASVPPVDPKTAPKADQVELSDENLQDVTGGTRFTPPILDELDEERFR